LFVSLPKIELEQPLPSQGVLCGIKIMLNLMMHWNTLQGLEDLSILRVSLSVFLEILRDTGNIKDWNNHISFNDIDYYKCNQESEAITL